MKKVILSSIAAAVLGVSLNATTYATVNGEDVNEQDIAVLMRAMQGAKFEELPADAKQKIVEQAVERKLLTTEAMKSGVEKEKDYTEALKKIKADLALEVWMKKIFDAVKVDPKDVKDYYDKNADKFMQPATVKARHVLVKTEQEANSTPTVKHKTKDFIYSPLFLSSPSSVNSSNNDLIFLHGYLVKIYSNFVPLAGFLYLSKP